MDCARVEELLLRIPNPADPDVLYESERNLRRLNFLHDNSRIETVPRDDGRVDVVVRTRDIWTTRPSVSLKREGGRTTGRGSFFESNLLGLGKSAGIVYKKELDRTSGGVEYSDPRLLGTRWTLDASYFDRSDGIRGVEEPVIVGRHSYLSRVLVSGLQVHTVGEVIGEDASPTVCTAPT